MTTTTLTTSLDQIIAAMNAWHETANIETDNWADEARSLVDYSEELSGLLRDDQALFALTDGTVLAHDGTGWYRAFKLVFLTDLAADMGVPFEALAGFTGHLPSGTRAVTPPEADEIWAIWESTTEGVYSDESE